MIWPQAVQILFSCHQPSSPTGGVAHHVQLVYRLCLPSPLHPLSPGHIRTPPRPLEGLHSLPPGPSSSRKTQTRFFKMPSSWPLLVTSPSMCCQLPFPGHQQILRHSKGCVIFQKADICLLDHQEPKSHTLRIGNPTTPKYIQGNWSQEPEFSRIKCTELRLDPQTMTPCRTSALGTGWQEKQVSIWGEHCPRLSQGS